MQGTAGQMAPKEAWTAGSAHGPTPPPSESFSKEVQRRGGAFGPNKGNQKQCVLTPTCSPRISTGSGIASLPWWYQSKRTHQEQLATGYAVEVNACRPCVQFAISQPDNTSVHGPAICNTICIPKQHSRKALSSPVYTVRQMLS